MIFFSFLEDEICQYLTFKLTVSLYMASTSTASQAFTERINGELQKRARGPEKGRKYYLEGYLLHIGFTLRQRLIFFLNQNGSISYFKTPSGYETNVYQPTEKKKWQTDIYLTNTLFIFWAEKAFFFLKYIFEI